MREIKFVLWDEESQPPKKHYVGDAGWDLFVSKDILIGPQEVRDVPTGVGIQLPDDVWGMLTGRSSTLRKLGLLVTTGFIDSGYRGELFFTVLNTTNGWHTIRVGQRLAQLLLFPHIPVNWNQVELLDESDRREQGFGSTGQ